MGVVGGGGGGEEKRLVGSVGVAEQVLRAIAALKSGEDVWIVLLAVLFAVVQ